MTLAATLFTFAMGAGCAWLLSENRRAGTLADARRVGEQIGTELGRKHAHEIVLGQSLLAIIRRRRFNGQFVPDGYELATTIEFDVDGTTYRATISEAPASAQAAQ